MSEQDNSINGGRRRFLKSAAALSTAGAIAPSIMTPGQARADVTKELKWQTGSPLVRVGQQIIIASRFTSADGSKSYRYNVVFYYAPMKVWYGGPGIRVEDKDIELWAEVPAPDA